MANPAESEVQNLLPVQAYFNVDGSFNTFIGQNKPFYATPDPQQSGLQITNSTINSSVIGGITPAAGNFTTATVLSQPVGATDVVNLLALQSYAAGISWKQPCVAATLANITLSGLQTIDGHPVTAGNRVLVKNQSTAADNGIYLASASAWTRSSDANSWDELICAISFIEYGTQAGGAWFCTAQDGGTLGVTAVNWAQFTTSATYSAGTGLTLTGTVFSITPVGTASTYGSASTVPVFTTNASGQVSSVTNTNIAIGATQITSGTIDSARISGSYTGITGVGTLTDLTVTNNIVGSITGNAATATTATNITGGAAGSVPYQTGSGATGFLAAGTNGQVLTLASGVPSWATPTTGTVTSVSGAGTVNGLTLTGTVTTSGSITLGGTLDLSSPPTIGNTAPNTGAFTTLSASTSVTTPIVQATNSGGLALRNSAGTTQISMGGGGGDNVSINVATNINGANAQIDISPTGTGHVHIKPSGTGGVEIAPTSAGTMNNMVIGGTTPLAGTFTDLRFNGTLSAAGSTGTSGFVLTSNGASAPTWQVLPATGLGIVDDTTTNATRYITFTSATSGNITTENVSSTKLQYNPSTGFLSSTGVIAGAGTVSAPALTTTGDTNTGIYFPAADTIAFTEGGVESMRIDSSGNLGLGTSSPNAGYQLDVGSKGRVRLNPSTGTSAVYLNANNTGGSFYIGRESSTGSDFSTTAYSSVLYSTGAYPMSFWTNAAERMRIDSSGNVGIGKTNPSQKLDVSGNLQVQGTNSFVYVDAGGASGSALKLEVTGSTSVAVGADSNHPLLFKTNAAERMRIDSAGEVLVGKTSTASSVAGIRLNPLGTAVISRNDELLFCNRLTTDGALVQFQQDGTSEGNISVSGTTVSYNGGHLSRWSQLPNGSKDESIVKGTVMSNLDDMCVWEKDGVVAENEQLNKMKVSDVEGDTNVAGVFVNWTIDEDYGVDDMNVAMTGDMIIRIADGVVVQKGDLLMSAGDGTAKPQGDDIVRSKTIAKVTSNYVTCTYADGSYCVPCVLMAC